MTTSTLERKVIFICDGCDGLLGTGVHMKTTFDFSDADRTRRLAGWSAILRGGVWKHFCKECRS